MRHGKENCSFVGFYINFINRVESYFLNCLMASEQFLCRRFLQQKNKVHENYTESVCVFSWINALIHKFVFIAVGF